MDNMEDMDELNSEERQLRELVRMSCRRERATEPDVDQAWTQFRQIHKPLRSRRRFSPWHLSAAVLAGAAAMLALVWLFPQLGLFSEGETGRPDLVAMQHDKTPQHVRLEQEGKLLSLTDKDSISFHRPSSVAKPLRADVPTPKTQRLSTSRGMDFKVILSDGSEVWLNAESTIEFPAAFRTGQRRVKLQGEAYFKVAHDEKAPFIVSSEKMDVRVLGTEFNLRSYATETPSVALIEGKVEVMHAGSTRPDATLSPGEEARLDVNGDVRVQEVDTYAVTQWVKGFFYFHDRPLVEVLRELGRWYNLGVIFHNAEAMDYRVHFSAMRNDSVEVAVESLNRLRHVHIRIEGDDLVVY